MIELVRVRKAFGAVPVLVEVSLTIPDRGKVAIMGPSGSGKTTLLRLIAGLTRPDAGEVRLDGRQASTPERLSPPAKRSLGFVFQTPALWPHMTVLQNISFGLSGFQRDSALKRCRDLLESAGISRLRDRYPHEISGGEAQRVSLLRAIAPCPRHLLMDEPFSNLDPATRSDLIALIREWVDGADVSLVFVSHDLAESQALSDRILLLKDRQLRELP